MTVHQAEAVVLRTWPIHEADLIVSLLTRDQGKIKGVAKAASKSRRRFGGALEPMTHVLANYAEKPRQELVRLDSFEIVTSPLSDSVDYTRAAALAFYSEVLEEILPDRDPQDAVFRLVLAVLDHTRTGGIWMPVTYFALWITRLMGWMPDVLHCTVCGEAFVGRPAYWHAHADGLVCVDHKRLASSTLSVESLAMALRIFRQPITVFANEDWPRSRAADLRRFAIQGLERHLERRLTTAVALAKLGG
ncbi:DNA repair protein RecO [Alloacidobacterium dinghuense]|uniref:DNA repair protein RecO n=1 Tax=Alloacidobacterium dinghuense TaxID=2763107 RepID=A0A7G8BME5_9BACT|nr:DNA repair protein RecO [Alloacidobacterium dinghuense]QNI33715.1 DNA repair protein RecO [Alloacidobacterium dinghuense]